MAQDPQYRTIELAILRTWKQILREGNETIYSKNVFRFSEPKQVFRFMRQIGPTNVKFLHSLDIWAPWTAELSPWVILFRKLSKEATILQNMKLGWGADSDSELPWAEPDDNDETRFLIDIMNEKNVRQLREYQEGTENLIP
ncbi:hypothetical protein N7462_011500 [Penicillium macrosclerotiorum]|uniref:uncharacterized protein n=1 Tax=Penicillium macrosclerotiorum TaxID=303699 RepID=UPI0025493393|nr:uncharacterized protein N7462_011500 [Penicillium macrosclerotiorum]KAJ5664687.1 hypothetical protein N7462_011500 [Penicillium macrosclerotiorum]